MTSLADAISAVARDLPGEYVDRLARHLIDVPGPTAVGMMQAGDLVAVPAFRAAVGSLPDLSGLAASRAWLVEGTRTALPLEPLAGSKFQEVEPLPPGSVVTVTTTHEVDGLGILAAAPILIGAPTRLLAE